jgi:hypothetical protein
MTSCSTEEHVQIEAPIQAPDQEILIERFNDEIDGSYTADFC